MGKLIEQLERLQKSTGPRMGFGSAAGENRRCMAIVAVLASADAKLAGAAVTAGADSILVRDTKNTEGNLAGTLGVAGTVPVGSPAGNGATGVNFAVAGMSDQVVAGEADDVDTVLELEVDTPEETFRTLEGLPADAFLAPEPVSPLTYAGLIGLYRVIRATNKPVLTSVAANTGAALLQSLRDAGVAGVLVKVDNTAGTKALGELRKKLEALPPKKSKTGRSRSVSFGLTPSPAGAAADDEDDYDDED